MKPEPGRERAAALQEYVQAVAALLGVEPTACWSEHGNPSTAYIALAVTCRRHPGRLLMAQWSSDSGWCLALEPPGAQTPVVIAQWPRPAAPDPVVVARRVHQALAATTTPGTDPYGRRVRTGNRRLDPDLHEENSAPPASPAESASGWIRSRPRPS